MITPQQYEDMIRVQTEWLKKCARHRIEREKQILKQLKAEYEKAKKEQATKQKESANTVSDD